MPFLKIQDFDKHMAANKISPVYLFAGEEFYLIDRCLAGAERALNADDLNKEVFHAGESSADDILNALQTLPFLSDRRIVVIKETHKLKAADAEILSGYVSNPVETSSLIMLYPGNYKKESVLKRKELISKCSSLKSCIAVDCRRQYESEVKEFIKSEFAKRGKSVSFDAITRI
ncbi:MAG: hypothetical protein FWC57_06140, partial [Endomicrobia bacterium]|nr:hypothetical protein [Endomicrobiia bacterium]